MKVLLMWRLLHTRDSSLEESLYRPSVADKRGEKASAFFSGSAPWLTSFSASCDAKVMFTIKTSSQEGKHNAFILKNENTLVSSAAKTYNVKSQHK